MRSLSKTAEQTLIAAIEQAATYVNGGMEPNAAIIKSASDASIPAGHINLMVHAYNTGRTNKQREQGENTFEKAADFKLADAETVLAALYPKTVKTSAELTRDHVVSTEYAVSPTGFLARRRSQLEKAAAATQALPEKTWTPPPRDPHAEVMRSYSQKRAEFWREEELRRISNAAYTKAANALAELAEYFRSPGNMPFQDAVREVGLRFGDEGVNTLKKVAAVYPHFEKQAATQNDYFGDNPVYGLVESTLSAVEEYVAAHKAVPVKQAAEKKEPPSFLLGSILHEPADEPLTLKEAAPGRPAPRKEPSAPLDSLLYGQGGYKGYRDSAKDTGSSGFNLTDPVKAVGSAIGDAGGAKSVINNVIGADEDPAKLKMTAYKSISTPEHELQLKNIRAQATLHDMMMNDPVISGYDPKEVAVAFNDVASTAPGIVESPAVLQAVLRKRLEAGQFADFDVKQLLEMEKTKTERDKLMLENQQRQQDLL